MPVLDLDYIEDSGCDTDMNVVMTDLGALRRGAGHGRRRGVRRAGMNRLLDLAEKGLGIRTALGNGNMCISIDEVEDRTQLMMNLRSRDYEVLMIDPILAGGTGEGLIRQAHAIAPKSNILVFTAMDELVYGMRGTSQRRKRLSDEVMFRARVGYGSSPGG
jgi:hypothetical protein